MPKILRIINRFNLGGPTYNAAYLTKYLSPEFETLLVGGMKDDSEESSEFILKNLGVDYKILPGMKRSINPYNDFLVYNEIKKIIHEFKPDIVHTHAAKAGALGRQAAYSCKVPVIVHTFHGHVFHSYFGGLKTSIYKTIERNLAKKTTAIIAISEKQKQELVETHRIVPAEKVHVIPLGFDLDRFQENQDEKRK
ncbi:MAG: glycosyltransferase, partial [Bacteroidia bacterium]